MEVLRGDGKLLENIDLDPPNKHQEVLYDQIERYEPRAIIAHVTVEADHATGQLIPTVEIEGVREDGY